MIVRQTQNTQEECHTLHTRQEQFVIQYQEVIKLQGTDLILRIWLVNSLKRFLKIPCISINEFW